MSTNSMKLVTKSTEHPPMVDNLYAGHSKEQCTVPKYKLWCKWCRKKEHKPNSFCNLQMNKSKKDKQNQGLVQSRYKDRKNNKAKEATMTGENQLHVIMRRMMTSLRMVRGSQFSTHRARARMTLLQMGT